MHYLKYHSLGGLETQQLGATPVTKTYHFSQTLLCHRTYLVLAKILANVRHHIELNKNIHSRMELPVLRTKNSEENIVYLAQQHNSSPPTG